MITNSGGPIPYRLRRCLILLAIPVLGIAFAFLAAAQTRDEYQVKAAFLLNFARFTDWPENAAKGPLTTCVLGRDPFGHWLKDLVEGRNIDGHQLVIRHISEPAEVSGCAILYIGASEPKKIWSVIAGLNPQGLLTIGEDPRGSDGAVINFILKDGRVRFAIDTDAAARTKLHISARLLSLAQSGD